MKITKIIAAMLCCAFLATGCGSVEAEKEPEKPDVNAEIVASYVVDEIRTEQ